MITKRKLKIYKKHRGDNDTFIRLSIFAFGRVKESDFFEIRDILQEVRLMIRGLCSDDYSNNARQKLIQHCDSQKTIDYLKLLADETEY